MTKNISHAIEVEDLVRQLHTDLNRGLTGLGIEKLLEEYD
jgi:hypothetical protein